MCAATNRCVPPGFVGVWCEHVFVSEHAAEAHILHADLDSFYASVEQRDDARLRGRPVIVGGGVVLAASYEAKAYGVHTPMGGAAARRLCPEAIVVPPRMAAYSEASRRVFEVFHDTTPLVEGLSIDEAFLDVGGLRKIAGPAEGIAARLRVEVAERVGLPITVGVAATKFLAKVASQVAKPDGLLVVHPGRELEFLHPLPVQRLWGVGAVTAEKLHSWGVRTVADVAALQESALVALLGPAAGRHLHSLALGRDPRRVQTGRRRRSIGAQCALGRSRRTPEEIDAVLAGLVDRVTRRMRAAGRPGRTVVLRLRFGDYTRVTRSHTLTHPTARTEPVLAAARALLAQSRPLMHAQGLSLVGIAVANLGNDGAEQLELPLAEPRAGPGGCPRAGRRAEPVEPGSALDAALDSVRNRFGSAAVTRGALLGRDSGVAVPLLPD
jgi:DNA polymerase-4